MTTQTTLTAKSLSNKAKIEIKGILSNAATFSKKHVPGCGYVWFVRDAIGNTIAKCIKEPGRVVLFAG